MVAMKRDAYYNKIEEILNNTTTYEKFTKNSVSIIERNLNNFLKKWLQKEYTKQKYFTLRSSDCPLPKVYFQNSKNS